MDAGDVCAVLARERKNAMERLGLFLFEGRVRMRLETRIHSGELRRRTSI